MVETNPFKHIDKVETVHSQRANKLLGQGWELLGVYALWRARKADEGAPFHILKGATFVVGRPRGTPEEEESLEVQEVEEL